MYTPRNQNWSRPKPAYMRATCPDEPRRQFNYCDDNQRFNKWISKDGWRRVQSRWQFQGDHYGIWDPAYLKHLFVTLIVQMPITECPYHEADNKKVIAMLDYYFDRSHGLAPSLLSACDLMVSDWEGNAHGDAIWYKCAFIKFSVVMRSACERISERTTSWYSKFNGSPLHWACELTHDNRPTRFKKKNNNQPSVMQKVFTSGNVDLSDFVPVDKTNMQQVFQEIMPMEDAEEFYACASNGGTGTIALSDKSARRFQLVCKHNLQQWVTCMNAYLGAAYVQQIMHSPFCKWIAHLYFADRLEVLNYCVTKLLASCMLPHGGLTLGRAKTTFPPMYDNMGGHVGILAWIQTGQIVLMNDVAIPCKEQWHADFGIVNDGPTSNLASPLVDSVSGEHVHQLKSHL